MRWLGVTVVVCCMMVQLCGCGKKEPSGAMEPELLLFHAVTRGNLGDLPKYQRKRTLPAPETLAVDPQVSATLMAQIGAAGLENRTLCPLFKAREGMVYYLTVPGTQAFDAWRKLRAATAQTRLYPVILGDLDNADMLWTSVKAADEDPKTSSVERLHADAQAVVPREWFAKQLLGSAEASDGDQKELEGTWPDKPSKPLTKVSTGGGEKECVIALAPAQNSWDIPRVLCYGGYSYVPVEVDIAVMYHWYDKYGAEIVALDGASIEMSVARPPADKDAAVLLAREHFAYAPDNVYQGEGSIAKYAASLMGSTVWSFWWD